MLAFSIDYYGMIFRATQSVELFCAYDIVDSIDYTVPILFCSSMIHRTGIIIFEIAFVLFLLYKARNLLARKRYKEE